MIGWEVVTRLVASVVENAEVQRRCRCPGQLPSGAIYVFHAHEAPTSAAELHLADA